VSASEIIPGVHFDGKTVYYRRNGKHEKFPSHFFIDDPYTGDLLFYGEQGVLRIHAEKGIM
jgi:hypothetical protein